jgi:hypothetical protein
MKRSPAKAAKAKKKPAAKDLPKRNRKTAVSKEEAKYIKGGRAVSYVGIVPGE